MPAQQPECVICVEKINRTKRAPIVCVTCDFVCCKECFTRFVSDEDHYLTCMSCAHAFTRENIFDMVGPAFVNKTYANIIKEILFKRETQLLDGARLQLEREAQIAALELELKKLPSKYNAIRLERLEVLRAFVTDHTTQTTPMEAIIRYQILVDDANVYGERQAEESDIRKKITDINTRNILGKYLTRPCSREGCSGIFSTNSLNELGNYICATCETIACTRCHAQMTSESEQTHKCSAEDLETLALISASTRPCPTCTTMITKLEGCNQMFCTSCRTPFNWDTMTIIKGRFHNPHTRTVDWNGTMTRDPLDVQCGRVVDEAIATRTLTTVRRHVHTFGQDFKLAIYNIVENLVGISRTINQLSRSSYANELAQLRLRYVREHINDDQFKDALYKIDRINEYRVENLQIAVAYRDSITDLFWPFIVTLKADQDIENLDNDHIQKTVNLMPSMLAQVTQLRIVFDVEIEKLSSVFKFAPKIELR